MGAEEFETEAYGRTPIEAFQNALKKAEYDVGHQGYSGTIAEKTDFKMVEIGDLGNEDPVHAMERAMSDEDHWVQDKWGPAGCVQLGEGHYIFFGWASS